MWKPIPPLLSVLLVGTGCAEYAAIAQLNRANQSYLAALEQRLSLDGTEKQTFEARKTAPDFDEELFLKDARKVYAGKLREKLASPRAATLRALSKAGIAKIEAESRFLDPIARRTYLNAELARIQTEFQEEVDAETARAEALVALYLKWGDALYLLRENGRDIQQYLDLGSIERTYTQVKGMNTEKLKQIADDLKTLSRRLEPVVQRGINGGAKR